MGPLRAVGSIVMRAPQEGQAIFAKTGARSCLRGDMVPILFVIHHGHGRHEKINFIRREREVSPTHILDFLRIRCVCQIRRQWGPGRQRGNRQWCAAFRAGDRASHGAGIHPEFCRASLALQFQFNREPERSFSGWGDGGCRRNKRWGHAMWARYNRTRQGV